MSNGLAGTTGAAALPLPEQPRRKRKPRRVNTRSVTVGLSALVHLAAIGLLLTLTPMPYPDQASTVLAVEMSLESEGERTANVPAMPFPTMVRPNRTAMVPPSDGPANHAFDLPAQPSFKPPALSPGLDMIGPMLDCLAGESASREASRRPPRAHSPCAFAALALRAPLTRFPTDISESTGGTLRAGDDYRSLKPVQQILDPSLLPAQVPQANRALKKWITGLFR
jgi:hypothetical protein